MLKLALLIILISLGGCATYMENGGLCFRFNPDIAEPQEEAENDES